MPTRQAGAKYARRFALGPAVLGTHGEIVYRLCWVLSPIETREYRYSGGGGCLLQACVFLSCAQNHGSGGFGLFGAEFFPGVWYA
jgi:hypothetical protein